MATMTTMATTSRTPTPTTTTTTTRIKTNNNSIRSSVMIPITNNRQSKEPDLDEDVPPPPSSSSPSSQPMMTNAKNHLLPKDPREKSGKNGNTKQQQRITHKATSRGVGRNTESFDPTTTLVRPDLRVQIGNPRNAKYNKPLKHDDVVIVPELFGPEDDWTMYHELLQEINQLQDAGQKGSEMISWHEGAHLVCKNPPTGGSKFQSVIQRLCDYFDIDSSSAGTRFNWYKDSKDWKPFHHDSAAFNPTRAKSQNITVGVSFGATRELAFLRATTTTDTDSGSDNNDNTTTSTSQQPCRLYFPQTNNGVFTFGRDVNIQWKHGINALPEDSQEQDDEGRISIILWGLARNVIEEDGSPPMLGADGRGPHAAKNKNYNNNNNKNRHNNKNTTKGKGGRGGGGGKRGQGGGRGGGGKRNNLKNNSNSNNKNSNNHPKGKGGGGKGGHNNNNNQSNSSGKENAP